MWGNMVASFLTQLTEWQFYTQHPVAALIGLFQLWMGVDAIRRRGRDSTLPG